MILLMRKKDDGVGDCIDEKEEEGVQTTGGVRVAWECKVEERCTGGMMDDGREVNDDTGRQIKRMSVYQGTCQKKLTSKGKKSDDHSQVLEVERRILGLQIWNNSLPRYLSDWNRPQSYYPTEFLLKKQIQLFLVLFPSFVHVIHRWKLQQSAEVSDFEIQLGVPLLNFLDLNQKKPVLESLILIIKRGEKFNKGNLIFRNLSEKIKQTYQVESI
jgi:hypothetical protein